MLGGLRSILFETTLRWPPLEGFHVNKEAIRRLYNKMFEPGGYRYENLDLQAECPTLSTRHADGHSVCKFGADFITIEEKKSHITVGGFLEVVDTVLRGLDPNEVPPFFIQQCKVQCLAQPANSENSLMLLAARVANVYTAVDPFERPPLFFGVRFRFPPVVIEQEKVKPIGEKEDGSGLESGQSEVVPEEGEAKEVPRKVMEGFVTVRFETYAEDISQVWMEVTAAYPQTERLLTPRIAANISDTYQFLEKSKRFLDQFDTPHDKALEQ